MSELWASIVQWIASHEPGLLSELPGLWTGETPEWNVAMNGHDDEVDGIPPLSVRLTHKVYICIGIVGPGGGVIGGGASEGDIIDHFEALTASTN